MKEMKQPNILIFMTDHQRADTVLPDQLPTPPDDVALSYPEELTRRLPPPSLPQPTPQPATQPTKPSTTRPKPPPTSEPTPPPSQPDSNIKGGYSIQIGSYRQAGGAAAKVNQWQIKGYDAFLSIGEVPNSGVWYRVRIGKFRSRAEARKFLDTLSQRENISAIIVRANS